MAHQPMAAVAYFVLGFLVFVSKHNEVAMVRRHERRHGEPIKSLWYISMRELGSEGMGRGRGRGGERGWE
jgi:hypothetical protein